MVQFKLQQALLPLALIATPIAAHPGQGGIEHEIAERATYLKHNPRNLDHCADKLRERGVHHRSFNRRLVAVKDLQEKAKLKKRSSTAVSTSGIVYVTVTVPCSTAAPQSSSHAQINASAPGRGPNTASRQSLSPFGIQVFNTSHLSNLSISQSTPNVDQFIFGNTSCILNPEGELGPYYAQGEMVRSAISEKQAGVPLYLDQQYINVKTCEPITNLWADIWHCNATGVYGGVVAMGNGNINDTSNINSTFLRGIQPTDSDGVVKWETIYPGYYQGRTTHIHIITHIEATQLQNGTITGGKISHVGQLMFDQSLTNEINANVSPYTDNTRSLTTNTEDSVFVAETLSNSDPVVNYVRLGEDLEDGIFAWITIGVDPTVSYSATPAVVLGAEGGHEYASGKGPGT